MDNPPGPMLTSSNNPPTIAVNRLECLLSRIAPTPKLTKRLEKVESLEILSRVRRVQAPPTGDLYGE